MCNYFIREERCYTEGVTRRLVGRDIESLCESEAGLQR